MKAQYPTRIGDRSAALCTQFGLLGLREQLVSRFQLTGLDEGLPLLLDLFGLDAEERCHRRTLRLLRATQLPHAKTLATLDTKILSHKLRLQIEVLCSGEFIDRAHNALLFGLPGVGKTGVAAAVGAAVCQLAYSVRFSSASRLAQDLRLAKRECQLPRALRKLDAFDLLIVDDLGYLQQTPKEAEVLFTLIAERYERRSLMLTTNLMFSQWSRIFRDEMAAAVDRLVHHAVILEFHKDSYRGGQARADRKGGALFKLTPHLKRPLPGFPLRPPRQPAGLNPATTGQNNCRGPVRIIVVEHTQGTCYKVGPQAKIQAGSSRHSTWLRLTIKTR